MIADRGEWRGDSVTNDVEIRCFAAKDAVAVCDLFVQVNRLLAPAGMADAFEAYIARSMAEEIGRVIEYYEARRGGFWVAVANGRIAGMFGLEPSAEGAMELRRMYVDPASRRRGIARRMLAFAEEECRRRGRPRMDLSTSELQEDALRLYRNSGYTLVREDIAAEQTNKTLGGGIRRYYFVKTLA